MGEKVWPIRPRRLPIVLALLVLALTGAVLAVPAAAAQDRPVGVAHEKTAKNVSLNADGSLSAATRLKCDPGWESSDFTVFVSQAGVSADGLVEPAIPCDGRWHVVRYSVPSPGNGAFHPGKAHFTGQFLVFNSDSGDPSAAHEQITVSLRRLAPQSQSAQAIQRAAVITIITAAAKDSSSQPPAKSSRE